MTGTCDCGRQLRGGRQQCRQCAIEADAQPTASAEESAVERYEFAPECAACGEATYLGEWLLEDGTRAANGAADEDARYFCPECQPEQSGANEDQDAEDAPEFEPASEIRTDGGCDLITVSTHARGRWLSRSDQVRLDPRVAWDEAEPFELHDLEGDEGRWHETAGVVLIRKNCTLVTVLNEDLGEVADRAELLALGADVAPIPEHADPEAVADGGESV